MNTWQAARQLKYVLQTVTWSASPNQAIFANVLVTNGIGEEHAGDLVTPTLAVVRVIDGVADPASPDLKWEQRFELDLVTANSGDSLGEFSLVGGQRLSQGKSAGRGLLEIEERVLNVLNLGDQTLGFNIILISASSAEATLDPERSYIAHRSYVFRADLTTLRTYQTPNFGNVLTTVVGANSGGFKPVTVSWAATPPRFDLTNAFAPATLTARGQLLLTRKAGATAPSSPSDGTPVALAGTLPTFASDSIATGSGTWTYGLFAQHDEYGDGATSLQLSSPAVATVTV